jgi:valyl-tRNA synthetase
MLLYDYAREFEAGEFQGLYYFINFINSLIDKRTTFDDNRAIGEGDAVRIVTDSATIFLPLSDIVDTEKERARLEGEQKKLVGEIERIEKKLSNEGFVAKAPAAVVEGEKAKLAKYRENLDGVLAALAKLN